MHSLAQMKGGGPIYLAAQFLLFMLSTTCVCSDNMDQISPDTKWDASAAGTQLLFELEAASMMHFVDTGGPSSQLFVNIETGLIHSDAESMSVSLPDMLMYIAIPHEMYHHGQDAWVPIFNSQFSDVVAMPWNHEQCWYSTNASNRMLQSGGLHQDQISDENLIGCWRFSLNFAHFIPGTYVPLSLYECVQQYPGAAICSTHTITRWRMAPISANVAPVAPWSPSEASTFFKLHLGSIYRVRSSFFFEFMQADASIIDLEKKVSSFIVFRNKINFVYLIQHNSFCNVSHLIHRDAEALVAQWQHQQDCQGCFFFPNSTQNEGRNELWRRTFEKWPGTLFTYYIFLDGDASLVLQPNRNELFPLPNSSVESLPFRVFEQHLLHYRPAVAVPFHSAWHVDNGSAVQFVSNFDHIAVAVHADVARMFLPTETIFDDISWFWAQRLWGFLCSIAFPQQTIQINAVMSDNGSLKGYSGSMGSAQATCSTRDATNGPGTAQLIGSVSSSSKVYMRNTQFEKPLLWFLASLKKSIQEILPSIQANLNAPQPVAKALLQPLRTDGWFGMTLLSEFSKTFDFLHPYWINHRFVLVANRTFFGYTSPCLHYADAGHTSIESCEGTNFDMSSKTQVDSLMMMMALSQLIREQNESINKLINAIEKRLPH